MNGSTSSSWRNSTSRGPSWSKSGSLPTEIRNSCAVGEHTFRISALRNDSTLARTRVGTVVRAEEISVSAYPNPFRENVNLSVTLPERRSDGVTVRVDIYDILGRRVATPISSREIGDSQSLSLGSSVTQSLGSGVYFFRVWNEDFAATTKAVRVR